MIYSSRHVLEIRSQFLSITPEQWLLLTMGVIVGCAVWKLFIRRIVHRVVGRLNEKAIKVNTIALVEGVIGGTVFLANACLIYLSTAVANFFLFSFALTGLLVGAWITIPASFE
ncbi:MAG: hypothetical protein HGJ94_18835 [Desulfosarcina sp.]|nr:hypothetical protein [Desulfosarcina sp.]MBC2743815.1 hypothetical protein [Desulfosarcina sp.]MBC2766724.1 hypothetical protein [Desulfosarcina sp.]